ncbi:MAG: ferrous iron transport protein B [Oscillospiraceae bacterium]|nr:ferrous iron transport protein B [Oscillospiraceae bacterium]
MRIAFAGNPNSGKTTMYNALTGRSEKVGNWAGVTVDKKESPIKSAFSLGREITAVDLPGAYSMSPFTSEESVTRDYIQQEHPDVIINIVDATNLSRSLFFTTQLLELGIPTVVALNKSDLTRKKKTVIDTAALSEALYCPVVETVSTDFDQEDLAMLIREAVGCEGRNQRAPYTQWNAGLSSKEEAQEADRQRFAFVNDIVKKVEKRQVYTKDVTAQDKLDAFLTHPVAGLGIFGLVMFLVFHISQASLGPWIADTLVGWIETFQGYVADQVSGAAPILQSLLVDGIIGGVGAVVGFLPLVMVMYFLIALLEDCGYMARATVVLDPIFKKVGLSGKSVIPFVVGTGCAIPGVMACRTIRDERERRATAMLAPFMPCGAKLPVIALFAGAFFEDAGWVGTLMYFLGIFIILIGALLVNRITNVRRRKSYFIIELPEYKFPSIPRATKSMCSRGWAYIVKAGTIILLCNTAVQVMQSFTWSFVEAETASESILASIAQPISWALLPIVGVASWQLAAAAVTGMIAKENVVGTLAVCFVGLENLIDTEELAMLEGAGAEVAGILAISKAAALAYLMFNLFTPPCFAALGAMNSEMGSRKWFWGGVALQLATGFTVAFLTYQLGTLITEGHFGAGFLPGLLVVAVITLVLTYLCAKAGRKQPVGR